MNTNMNVTIRRLTNLFILLFLLISGVAAYTQIADQAFYNGPSLVAKPSTSFLRTCPPYSAPVRGAIYDDKGNWIARSVPDPKATCGYRREYADWVATSGLAPLIGFYSYVYGTQGIEQSYDDVLSGSAPYAPTDQASKRLLHQPLYGNDVYLTIDETVQVAAAKDYDASAIYSDPGSGGPCQPTGTHPPGSILVEDPTTGEMRAMVSFPSFDPNRISDPAYWRQVNSDPGSPLFNHATQGLYAPGSTFKTATLLAGLDTGQVSLNTPYSFDEATNYVVNGEHIRWDDYNNGVWRGILNASSFPLTLEQGYQYSDNTIYARLAVQLGADTWLRYIRALGIAQPGVSSPAVPFDAPYTRSSVYPAIVNGKPFDFNQNALAESGFGQGSLLISPLTMMEITATVAANGYLYDPHVVSYFKGTDNIRNDEPRQVAFGGSAIVRPETAQAVRHAMWEVVNHGTAWAGLYRNGAQLRDSSTREGGKTGTAQLESGQPHTWWISLAPDDQAPHGGAAKYVVVVNKEHSGEGACQVFVADDIYKTLGL